MSKAKILLQEDDITISVANLTVPSGEYPIANMRSLKLETKQPLLGPICLALLGTIILGMAWNAQSFFDIGASLLMLCGGLYWRIGGIQHLLLVRNEDDLKEEAIWFTRNKNAANRAIDTLQGQIDKRRKREEEEDLQA